MRGGEVGVDIDVGRDDDGLRNCTGMIPVALLLVEDPRLDQLGKHLEDSLARACVPLLENGWCDSAELEPDVVLLPIAFMLGVSVSASTDAKSESSEKLMTDDMVEGVD